MENKKQQKDAEKFCFIKSCYFHFVSALVLFSVTDKIVKLCKRCETKKGKCRNKKDFLLENFLNLSNIWDAYQQFKDGHMEIFKQVISAGYGPELETKEVAEFFVMFPKGFDWYSLLMNKRLLLHYITLNYRYLSAIHGGCFINFVNYGFKDKGLKYFIDLTAQPKHLYLQQTVVQWMNAQTRPSLFEVNKKNLLSIYLIKIFFQHPMKDEIINEWLELELFKTCKRKA